ncbi:hypothetical protein LRP49_18620 [Enterovibrio sp. ZSDZ35]|uniref:Uncharacterized protein n=1 Tax=Enterovibrio qingdaonensis TaxID=2899818 RepID=A0ABT5QQD1_9GAMM|nr:hypothetical protein [Enterovibrio sp. ZSDZ35]MDD1783185.1 hypothetical protein [Enterovibrio sp. ZSDZ35]
MEQLTSAISTAIEKLPKEFTTHELILKVAKLNQHAYIEALHSQLDKENPFQSLHAKIGKFLGEFNSITNTKTTKTDSDIFGQRSENAVWIKAAQS